MQTAWTIDGGSTPPAPNLIVTAASGNVTQFTSIGDRIDGFPIGVVATAAKRHFQYPSAGPVSDSFLDLRLIQLQLNTSLVDIKLRAAAADGAYTPGDNNRLRALLIGVHGSGARANSYNDEVGLSDVPQNLGSGNRLEVVGTFDIFGFLNPDIDPGPPAGFFIGH